MNFVNAFYRTLSRTPYVTFCIILLLTLPACSSSVSETELISRAQQALHAGNARAAIIDLKTALQQQPDNPQARSLLGEAYLFQQKPAVAIDEFERSLKAKDDPAVRILYAHALMSAGRAEDLIKLHNEGAFTRAGTDPQYLATLGLAQAEIGNLEAAAGNLGAAMSTQPRSAYVEIADAFYRLIYTDETDIARQSLQDIVNKYPDNADAWSLLGDMQQISREFTLAEASYQKATTLNPFRLSDRLKRVTMLIELKNNEAALAELKQLETIAPDHPGVNFARGRTQLNAGDYATALNEFSKVLNVMPGHKGSLYLAAMANTHEGNFATAISQFNNFLTSQPKHLKARLQLAAIYLHVKEPAAAEQIAREVLAEQALNYQAMGILAAALSAQKSYEESIKIYQQVVNSNPDSVQARLALGGALLLAGDKAGSLREFTTARELDPTGVVVTERLIQVHIATGDFSSARQEANTYKTQHPQSSRPHLFLGQIALRENDLAGARDAFQKALQMEPGNADANRGLALLAYDNQDLDAARDRYIDTLAYHPDDIDGLISLALIEGQRGDTKAMRSALETAVAADSNALKPRLVLARLLLNEGDSDKALHLLNPLRYKHNHEPDFWLTLADALLASGDLSGASEAGQQAYKLLPQDAATLALVARIELHKRQYSAAENYLQQALALQPDNVNLQKLLIDALLGQRKFTDAGNLLDTLPQDIASDPAVHTIKGRIALAQNQPAVAETHLRAALSGQPESRTLLWLSGAITAQGREQEAIALLENWIAEKPDDMLVRNQLATSYLKHGDDAKARENYLILQQQAPDNVVILNNLAWLYRTEDPAMALNFIEKAEKLAPASPDVKDTYAMLRLEQGKAADALVLIQQALALKPDNADILYHKTLILQANGQREEARLILAELLTRTDFSHSEAARELMKTL